MRRSNYLLILIILLGLALRIWQLEKRAVFDFDQEIAAWWVKGLLIDHKFSLIGQELSVGGVFSAPFFFYLLAPFYFLFNLNPIAGNVFVSLVSVATIVMVYKLGKTLFSKSVGLFAALLYAVHSGINLYDRVVAQSNLVMFVSVSVFYLLVQKNKRWWQYLLLGLALGLTFSVHPTAVLLIPIVLIYLGKRKELPWVVVPILLLLLPLIIFDLRHHFLNLTNAISVLSGGASFSGVSLVSHVWLEAKLVLIYWAGLLASSGFWPIRTACILLAVFVLIKTPSRLFRLFLLVPLVFLSLYPRHVPEFYLLLLTPVLIIYSVAQLPKWFLVALVVANFFITLKNFSIPLFQNGLYYKKQAVEYIINQSSGQPFSVYYSNDPGQGYGFSYLFYWYKAVPQDGTSRKFQIVVPAGREKGDGKLFGEIKVIEL